MEVMAIQFQGIGVEKKLEIVVEGHPTQTIQKAHEVASVLLDSGPWHFTSLEFASPSERFNPGSTPDHRWLLRAHAEKKRSKR